MKLPWINHPRTDRPDTMLTLAITASLAAIAKFLLNGVSFELLGSSINLGTVDAGLVAALLTPTLGAYVARKYSDSPDAQPKEEKEEANAESDK